MSDDLRQYPATPRRLETLRRLGIVPSAAALAGVLGLAAATLVIALMGGGIAEWLRGMLAHDLQRGMAPPEALAGLLMARLGWAVVFVAGVGGIVAGAGVLARSAQGGLARHPGHRFYLPLSDIPHARGGRGAEGSLVLGLVGLGCAGLVYAAWLGGWQEATEWPGQAGRLTHAFDQAGCLTYAARWALWWVWWRWLAVLGGLAILHAVSSWWRYLQRARMTYREMLQERRETEGSWLKRRRRDPRGN